MAGRPRKINPTGEALAPSVESDVSGNVGEASALPAYQRENPNKLEGQALRDLAHKQGLARSEVATMSDEKIRVQLRYLAYSRAE